MLVNPELQPSVCSNWDVLKLVNTSILKETCKFLHRLVGKNEILPRFQFGDCYNILIISSTAGSED